MILLVHLLKPLNPRTINAPPTMTCRILFILWEPFLSGFVEVKFDGTIHDAKNGLDISSEIWIEAYRSNALFFLSILEVELETTRVDIIYARQKLYIEMIFI